MKKISIILALTTLSLSSFADNYKDFYAQINAGFAVGSKINGYKTGESLVFGAEAGMNVNDNIAAGLGLDYYSNFALKTKGSKSNAVTKNSVAYYANGTNNPKISSLTAMLNLNLHPSKSYRGITPYLLLGAGMSYNKTGKINLDIYKVADNTYYSSATYNGESKINFAYKAGLGARFAPTEDFDIDLHYHYVDLGKIQFASNDYFSTKSTKHLKANVVSFGVVFKF